ncbi:MAG: 4Fe-4S binding protein [Acidobacteria bacterium]|nr:4Fe-4S binding protein [Acidobacteriota bacterium]
METVAELESIAGLKDVDGWEKEWLIHREDPLDPLELDRRFGRASGMVDNGDRYVATISFPSRTPNHPLKYRHGMPDLLPDYKYHVEMKGNVLWAHATLEDALTSQLCGRVPDFPQKFSVHFDMPETAVGYDVRYWNRTLTVVVHKVGAPAGEKYEWRGHYITNDCVGCEICELKCPTNAITGIKKEMFVIEPDLCINCGVCGIFCPYDAIVDQWDDLVKRIKAKDIPKAVVIPDLCSGCEYCIDTCPFDCIHLVDAPDRMKEGGYPADMTGKVAWVDERTCVSCGICETFCIKEAIVVDRKFNWDPYIGFSYQEGRAVPGATIPGAEGLSVFPKTTENAAAIPKPAGSGEGTPAQS